MGEVSDGVSRVKMANFSTSSSQTQQMKKKYQPVPVMGITAREVLALWQEGKLYLEAKPASTRELLAQCQQETLKYVASIDMFVTDKWKPYINNVWETIVNDHLFASRLVMKQKHQMNRYFVTCLVYNLQTFDVYQSVSQLLLHRKLEGIKTRNSVFKNWGNYPISPVERKHLRVMLEKLLYESKEFNFRPE